MAIVITLAASAAVSIIAGIIVAEMYHVMPVLTDWLLRIATRRLSGTVKERCYEEWRAQLTDTASPLLRLIHAASLIWQANTVLHDEIDGYFCDLDTDLDGLMAETQKSSEERIRHTIKLRALGSAMRVRSKLIRAAMLIAALSADTKAATKLRALPVIWRRADPKRKRLDDLEKSLLGTFKLLATRDAQIRTTVRRMRVERAKAAAMAARTADHDTKTPVIVAELRQKLRSNVTQIRTLDGAGKKMVDEISAKFAAYRNGNQDADDVRSSS